ncbi:hypothetical protein CF15_00885 [Pyrodictium occultum]|uniref:KEOPS complex Pcc1-like subunit n=1 Tax=Pyrodictium occultum TaxID=2309 RepID=A0A0V8RTX1_PYROC|nr:KEOPS complex subunit Pcc1 [Pyrodictium occultum]KSW11443.1 hypothetical protein CF15_00885 [Pyrodictium occultum]
MSGCIRLRGLSEKLAKALARSLETEARNPPDPGRGRVVVRAGPSVLEICLEARDLSSARTLVNAYLSLAAAALEAVEAVGG